ncbi:NEDD4-like E3 ubiquitin-protein ligase [Quillaja saponaria]|uniref:NEDD4-like E3 ubiquitin-protein ligase n=1 Tax=Quillaja saponaria TaxID=32244 RepID=A0AAD7LMA7_QUISA|nr:NEDD4-like E3 ubiquitin-protein ligase [Quillaja saponaria]
MKDLSFFLLKNSVGAKMKKGIRNFCNGDGSTSTLNQQKVDLVSGTTVTNSSPNYYMVDIDNNADSGQKNNPTTTLEQMILQLELEEEIARKAKLVDLDPRRPSMVAGRMSCVNNSDILRSARNALNQYPRFSLDGKDAMYRSSFRNIGYYDSKFEDDIYKTKRCMCFPTTLGGEKVVWCKPGVVAKLMGLEAMPVPVAATNRDSRKERLSSIMKLKRQNLMRRTERHEMERRSLINGVRRNVGSCSRVDGYSVMKPAVEPPDQAGTQGRWRTSRYV